jgi:transcriptional regulator with XRE-family HTH domain
MKYFFQGLSLTFGEKLKYFANTKFGGVSKLAEALGMSQPNLSRYINGPVEPGRAFFKKLKEVGCSIDWLLSEEDSAQDSSPPVINNKQAEIDRLEEENRLLRGKLSQITILTQAVEISKKGRRKKD